MLIDAFAHVMPVPFAKKISASYPTKQLEELLAFPYFGDMENRVRVLDKYHIDKQIINIARPDIWKHLPDELLPEMVRSANDTVAEAAAKYPDRFYAVGTLPVPTEEFLPEFDRCINELGMVGIQVFSNVNGRYLDEDDFRPFFEYANKTKTPIWLHPQLRDEWSTDYVLNKSLGWPYDTSVAMCRLAFSGMMEELPDLTIITHHMGGVVPYYEARIEGFWKARNLFPSYKWVEMKRNPLEYLKRFYADTVLNGGLSANECGLKFFDLSHVVFATDYPFGPGQGETWIDVIEKQVDALELSAEEKEAICSKNILRIIERK